MKKPLTLIAVVLFGLFVICPPASAAGALVSSSPAEGARVSKAPGSVRLTFDRPVLSSATNNVTVTGPDGQQWQDGAMGVDENVMEIVLRPKGPAGDYAVDYDVSLGDQSPLTGRFTFTLAGAPDDTGWQTWAWLAGIVALIAAIATTAGVLQARGRL